MIMKTSVSLFVYILSLFAEESTAHGRWKCPTPRDVFLHYLKLNILFNTSPLQIFSFTKKSFDLFYFISGK